MRLLELYELYMIVMSCVALNVMSLLKADKNFKHDLESSLKKIKQ